MRGDFTTTTTYSIISAVKMVDQKVLIKFCVKNGIERSEVLRMMIKAFGEDTMPKKKIYEWYRRFKEGHEDIESDIGLSCPSKSIPDEKVEEIQQIILSNRRITSEVLSEEVGIPIELCEIILKDKLGLIRVEAKLVSKNLNFQQKLNRKHACQDALDAVAKDSNLLTRIITGGEIWLYNFDDVANDVSRETWNDFSEPSSKKERKERLNSKVLLIIFFDYQGIIHYEFLPKESILNKEYYVEVLDRLRQNIYEKRSNLWSEGSWILHHEETPMFTSLHIRKFLARHGLIVLQQPPHSPDLVPCDFFLYTEIKNAAARHNFHNMEATKENLRHLLETIPCDVFENCFIDWKERWSKCFTSEGEYIK